ncbi:unnamed protein product [Owenia fusiformis]|uniref:Sushi, von Willebrand factor type A, EGF and pentraxin domain-containing protein 1-like n=1 Tax=Owenia fusiformis TaxID=6347 RepID=A0A8S4PWP6_OWEFU|nr:unnamed protein product [Owenia fusiformis]
MKFFSWRGAMLMDILLLMIRNFAVVCADRCDNPDCSSPLLTTVYGVDLRYCPEMMLGENCDEKVQYFLTEDLHTWDDDICATLDYDLKYAIDSQDDERFTVMKELADLDHAWIGLKKTEANTWANSVWVDGTPYNTSWSRWPDVEDTWADCLELASDGDIWHTHDCGTFRKVLCQKVYECDQPFPEDINAVVTDLGDTVSYYYSVKYTCNTGFYIDAGGTSVDEVVQCRHNVWDVHTPCESLTCSDPPIDSFAYISLSSETLNLSSTVTYTCHTGYSIGGGLNVNMSETMTCLDGGVWDVDHSFCGRRSCGPPLSYTGSNVTYSGTLYGDDAVYHCNEGYTTYNNPYTVECLSNTTWGYAPICKLVDCGPAPSYPNVHVISVNGTLYKDIVLYACKLGYELSEPAGETLDNITCQASGIWTNLSNTCQPKDCGNPFDDPNAEEKVNGTLYNDTLLYDCDIGYVLSDNANIDSRIVSCLGNGSWESHSLCTPVDCGSPQVDDNAIVTITGTSYGDMVQYNCSPGYRLGSSDTEATTVSISQCLSNGSWSWHIACFRVSCGPHQVGYDDANINVTINDGGANESTLNLFNETISYSCNVGYVINGTNETNGFLRCTETGGWSEYNACVRRSCGPPPIYPNAIISLTNSSYRYETMASYQCIAGYSINGTITGTITCQADGTWEYMSSCSIILCNDPPVDTYANLTQGVTILHKDAMAVYDNVTQGRPFMYNDTVIYSCRQGYFLNGRNVSISCGERGQWFVNNPCVISTPMSSCSCGNLEEDPNATPMDPNLQNYTCGSVAILRCKDGYHIDGRNEGSIYEYVQCLQNGTWSSRSYCISSSSNTWIRAKRVVFEPEEAYILRLLTESDVYLIFDRYKYNSIKNSTRSSRAQSASRVYKFSSDTPLPAQNVVLNVTENKVQLIKCVIDHLTQKASEESFSNILVITGPDPTPVQIHKGNIDQRDDLRNTQEEADVVIVHQVLHAASKGQQNISVLSDDTDDFLLLLHHCLKHKLMENNIIMEGTSSGRANININATVNEHKLKIPNLLPVHGLSSSDMTSCMHGIGKLTVLKV